jgi:hypothetical protein
MITITRQLPRLTSLLTLVVLMLRPCILRAGVYNNSGISAEDSIAIVFQPLDSLGNPVDMAAGDSVYLAVFYPGGKECFRDSMAYNNSRIAESDWEDYSGGKTYAFHDAVAHIDGAGLDGTYKYCLTVDDNTGANLQTSFWGEFQVYAGSNLSDLYDMEWATAWSEAQRDSILRSLRWSDGNSLARLGDVGLGSGAKTLVVFLIDTSGVDDTIPDVLATLKDAGQTANLAQGRSLAPGKVAFAVNAATDYIIVPALVGFVWPPLVAIHTSGGAAPDTVNVLGYNFDPGAPASASLCRVYGWVHDLSDGKLVSAEVRARVNESPLRYQDVVVSAYERTTLTDDNGYWYLDLYPSALLTPNTTKYEIEIRYTSGAILRRKLTVPNNTSWLLTW